MRKDKFQLMWESMQKEGYFRTHPHYADHFGVDLSAADKELDSMLLDLDFSLAEITMPVPYSEELERAVKRTESRWLRQMFNPPAAGVALDIGCGFGRTVAWMQQYYSSIIATDISREAIDAAQERFQSSPIVRFYVNEADALPAEIAPGSIDFAYAFTVFQHIPREFTTSILAQLAGLLTNSGVVVFNLLSGINESEDSGIAQTEWAIGYSEQQAAQLLKKAGLKPHRMVLWSRPETAMKWLWVRAGR